MRFRPDHTFEPGIRRQALYKAAMRAAARVVYWNVLAVAPERSGNYRRKTMVHGNKVVAEPHFWHLIEFGSVNNPPYAPLRRGVQAAGLEFELEAAPERVLPRGPRGLIYPDA